MGCFPVGYGPIEYHRKVEGARLRHDSADRQLALGGRSKTWPLIPEGTTLTPEASADLEIRRAIRAGLDGFAIDAWAGGETACNTLDALFKAAESGKYPFEVTICLDPSTLPKGEEGYYSAIKYLLDKHGNSSNLARRNGKPLIFGYSSQGLIATDPSAYPLDQESKWNSLSEAYKHLEKRIGQPLFFHFGMEHFFIGGVNFNKLGMTRDEAQIKAAGFLGRNFNAVGLFLAFQHLPLLQTLSQTVREGGAEWAPPISIQYDNILGNLAAPDGTAHLRKDWEHARQDHATLIQFGTWNDYGEHTSLAPTFDTGYGFGAVNHYFAQWWKDGAPPKLTQDQIYVTYRKYPSGSRTFPFPQWRRAPDCLEVLTLLTKGATIRLPGRTLQGKVIEYKAPSGLFVKQFPNAPGVVSVELIRGDKTEEKFVAPDPITDKPFREDNTLVCASTEDARFWQEDFSGIPYPQETEYGDVDGDGLPNWFEMYWFGKWNDFSTASAADPNADPDGDGKTNLQEYQEQTDPTCKPAVYKPDYVWSILDIYKRNFSVNTDRDTQGTPVWHYLWRRAVAGDDFVPMSESWMRNLTHQEAGGSIRWKEGNEKDDPSHPEMKFYGRAGLDIALGWESPVNGVVDIRWKINSVKSRDGLVFSVIHASDHQTPLWNRTIKQGDQLSEEVLQVSVNAGDKLLFVEPSLPVHAPGEFIGIDQLTITLRAVK